MEQLSVIPADTDAATWWKQMQIRARQTPNERLAIWAETNEAFAVMQEQSVRRRHPDYTDREVFWALLRVRHGDAFVDRVLADISPRT
jgi:RNA 3'-terminal phosphate cyclase